MKRWRRYKRRLREAVFSVVDKTFGGIAACIQIAREEAKIWLPQMTY